MCISGLEICTVPSLVYILLRCPLRLSFLPKKAISLQFLATVEKIGKLGHVLSPNPR